MAWPGPEPEAEADAPGAEAEAEDLGSFSRYRGVTSEGIYLLK
jgi:hypothetical protein